MVIAVPKILSAFTLFVLMSMLTACSNPFSDFFQADENDEPSNIPNNVPYKQVPHFENDIPIGVALIRSKPTAADVGYMRRSSIALSVHSEFTPNWFAVGPAKMVSRGNINEQLVLLQACGGYMPRFIQVHGRFRVHLCVNRPLLKYDIDVAKKYHLPLRFY